MTFVIPLIMLVVLPCVTIWQLGLKGFIPAGRCVGRVVSITRHITNSEASCRRNGVHQGSIEAHFYPVVEYVTPEGHILKAECVYPDDRGKYPVGTDVSILYGRDLTQCWICKS